MKFGSLPLNAAEGAVLAHSIRLESGVLKKGLLLTREHLTQLALDGVSEIVAARLEPGDAPENEAAARVAAALAPEPDALGLEGSAAVTGRVNFFAKTAGVLRIDEAGVAALNAIDEAVTLATAPAMARVARRQMAATIKIIPYAAPVAAIEAVERLAESWRQERRALLKVAPFRSRTASLFLTVKQGMKESLIEKGAAAIKARLDALGATLVETKQVAHETAALTGALRSAEGDMLLILGASATSDRRDVAPAAIVAAGGVLERGGMPVDPGNLLVLGRIGDRPAIGLPGCARSPKLNGADWVLERLIAGIPVESEDIAAMGVGGLLKEIPSRPEPRGGGARAAARPFVSAILLAAGGSSRMGGDRHKLLEPIDGAPLIRRAAERLLQSQVDEVVVVLGARAAAMRAAIDGLGVRIVENPVWSEGMAASIRAGLTTADARADAVLLALADMPDVDAPLIDRLLAAFDPEEDRAIVRPVARNGRPGHPVLFGRRFFEALSLLTGDAGARDIVRDHAGFVIDVPIDSEAPVIDLDTPEDWAGWLATLQST